MSLTADLHYELSLGRSVTVQVLIQSYVPSAVQCEECGLVSITRLYCVS